MLVLWFEPRPKKYLCIARNESLRFPLFLLRFVILTSASEPNHNRQWRMYIKQMGFNVPCLIFKLHNLIWYFSYYTNILLRKIIFEPHKKCKLFSLWPHNYNYLFISLSLCKYKKNDIIIDPNFKIFWLRHWQLVDS
jgi:hypothetical protein